MITQQGIDMIKNLLASGNTAFITNVSIGSGTDIPDLNLIEIGSELSRKTVTFEVLGDSLSARWSLNEGVGSVIENWIDRSWGFVSGAPLWVSGLDAKFGKAIDFVGTGSDQYCVIPDDAAFSFTSGESFSVSAWFKSSTSHDQSIMEKWGSTAAGAYPYVLRGPLSTNRVRFAIFDDSNSPQVDTTDGVNLADGAFHQIVGVRDKTAGSIYIYHDGANQQGTPDTTTADIQNAENLTIGGRKAEDTSTSGKYFTGTIDEVRTWRKALSEREVQFLFDWQLSERITFSGTWNSIDGSGATSDITNAGLQSTATNGSLFSYGTFDPVTLNDGSEWMVEWDTDII